MVQKEKYYFDFHYNISSIKEVWHSLTNKNDVFWSYDFLSFLEHHGPNEIQPIYCIVYDQSKSALALLYFQHKYIQLKDSLRLDTSKDCSAIAKIKSSVVNKINFHNLVNGNMLLTGNYGFYSIDKSNKTLHGELSKYAISSLIDKLEKDKGIKIGTILAKDFNESQSKRFNQNTSFTGFQVQPSMIFKKNHEWNNFEDYVASFKAKYRTRYNRAVKKKISINQRELSIEELDSFKIKMNELYKNIADSVSFNLFYLPEDYFLQLKKCLGEYVRIDGYFQGDELVGFFSAIQNNSHLDAHFLGYSKECNQECQLYLNMLYDLIKLGFEKQKEKIYLSRTAMEIKSSVGAKAENLYLYLSHTNIIYNNIIPTILKVLAKQEKWEERSPFKSEEEPV